jgi:hypothetical protein
MAGNPLNFYSNDNILAFMDIFLLKS